jgi:hypothetical protein
MNQLGINLTDQVVVFQPTIFQPQFQALPYRVWKVLGGFGASPLTNGRKLFCRALLDGEETTFDGMAVERLATAADVAAVTAARAGQR